MWHVRRDREISKQNKLICPSFILSFPATRAPGGYSRKPIKVANDSTRLTNTWRDVTVPVISRGALLQVFEEASVAEVVDVAAEKHQLRVHVVRHAAVCGRGVADGRRHHEGGGAVAHALPASLYQGTKSGGGGSTRAGHFLNIWQP